MIIDGMSVLIIAKNICPDCLKKWNSLLEGDVEEIEFCHDCSEKLKKEGGTSEC